MTLNDAQSENFTGLVLLTGIDKPGIANSLFETLSPFAVKVFHVEQIVINQRLILTVLIGANPAHQSAIEDDLNACALSLDVDIATLFSKGEPPTISANLTQLRITSPKLLPRELAAFTDVITSNEGNINRIQGTSLDPVSIEFDISGIGSGVLEKALSAVTFDPNTSYQVIDKG